LIVIDSSAAVELMLLTPAGRRIGTRIFDRGEDVHAPHLIDVEVAHALRRLAITGTDATDCHTALEDWMKFNAVRYPHGGLLERAWELRANFSAYDALFIALAEALRAPLVTHDRKLASRGHAAQVEVI
jgi:predicted nucleic acid-binding protein